MRPDRPIPRLVKPIRAVIRRWRTARMRVGLGPRLRLGSNVTIGANAVLLSPQELRIGNNVSIGRDFHVETNVVIGDDVLISSRVGIVGRDHRMDDPTKTIYWAGRLPPARVVLEGDNLVGFGVVIVAPATIGRGCVIGAGAVVVGDLPPNTVCVGTPARPIRARYPPTSRGAAGAEDSEPP